MVTVELAVMSKAARARVWECLVEEVDKWWGEPYVASPDRQRLTLDARPGGSLFEDWGEGDGLIWATVRAVKTTRRIIFDGTFNMPGAIAGVATLELDDVADGTRISISQSAVGAIADDVSERFVIGWEFLLSGLAANAER